ncbi:hypothetical protein PBY51_019941 [Eleginops maclovinus]|uniref:Uncharacterized protein n=1 Tax=Eleginops maclovinus TaxID=56733 RepID=A0AAN8ASK8_ELEMC|nr:hypothetical protein PBY51_019941 [Eleginops maclovinus]
MANWSQVRGQTKIGSKDLMTNKHESEDTRPGGSPGSPFWSQAQKEDSSASVWWPGLPRSPAGHSLKKQRGQHLRFPVPRAHHLRETAMGSGALPEGWQ